jgi:hypothetical protein
MEKPNFINVDLELSSDKDLSLIATELKSHIFILEEGFNGSEFILRFECSLNKTKPEPVLKEFIRLIHALSAEATALLGSTTQKIFDVGFDSGHHHQFTASISNAVLHELSSLGFEMVITIYPTSE